MATQIEQAIVPSFEKVLSQNSQFAEKFIGAFKKIMTNISAIPEIAKKDIQDATRSYLEIAFNDLDVKLPNIDELSNFLVRNIDSVQPIISACSDIRSKFPNSGLKLLYEIETEDLSGEENVTLYVKGVIVNSIHKEEFKQIASKYKEYFIDSGVLFTIQFDTLTQ